VTLIAAPGRRELRLVAVVRVVIALALAAVGWITATEDSAFSSNFVAVALIGCLGALGFLALAYTMTGRLTGQLVIGTLFDAAILTTLLYQSGGLRSGLAVLCVTSVAGASVLATVRLARFMAASATLMLLLGAVLYELGSDGADLQALFQAGLIGLACFVTAEIISRLARSSSRQQALAEQRGADLKAQLALTELALAEVPQAVLVVDAQGHLQLSNRAAQSLLGLSATSIAAPVQGWSSEAAQRLAPFLESSTDADLELPQPQGQPGLPVRVRCHPAPDGSPAKIVVIEDLHAARQQAEQLKLAAMGRLSASIAHEIRNPLAAIRHANALLTERAQAATLPASALKLHGMVESNSVRIDRIVEDVLALARQEPVIGQQCDPSLVAAQALDELAIRDPMQHARVACTMAPSLVQFDAQHLHQVLMNLLNNALRHASPAKPSVVLSARAPALGRLELHVADDGPGLSEMAKQHLFEPFFTTSTQGVGLGLSLARQICELNGAHLEHRSEPISAPHANRFVIVMRTLDSR
jgi:two-component system sensor histidine kinase PilS (NtrC family)